MIRVDIETIIMASGPIPSTIVLRERAASSEGAPARSLSIQTGSIEAAAISHGIHGNAPSRPITHDLFLNTLDALDTKLERVEVVRVEGPVFFAHLVLVPAQHDAESSSHEVAVDARPSDALALAVRANAPIYVEDDIMNRLGTMSFGQTNDNHEEEIEQFDRFVQNLSPDDF